MSTGSSVQRRGGRDCCSAGGPVTRRAGQRQGRSSCAQERWACSTIARSVRRTARRAARLCVLLAGRLGVQHACAFCSQDGSGCSIAARSARRTARRAAPPRVLVAGRLGVQHDRLFYAENRGPPCSTGSARLRTTVGAAGRAVRGLRTAVRAAGPAALLHARRSVQQYRRACCTHRDPCSRTSARVARTYFCRSPSAGSGGRCPPRAGAPWGDVLGHV
jgi:hypothetical protein